MVCRESSNLLVVKLGGMLFLRPGSPTSCELCASECFFRREFAFSVLTLEFSFPHLWLSLFPSLMNAPFDGRSPARATPVHRQVCVGPGCGVDSKNSQGSFYLLARSRCVPPTVSSGRNGTTVGAGEEKGDLHPWLPPSCPHSRPSHVSRHGCVSPMC